MARSSSGTYLFQPPVADLMIDALERIQIFGPAIEPRHIISGRRSANLILSDWSNRGVNLWVVGDDLLSIPLQAGVASYPIPRHVVDILDAYLRTYTPGTVTTTLGEELTPMTANGVPMVAGGGDPMIIGLGSGTLTSVAGSPVVTFRWPSHGLQPGEPIFWTTPVSIGGLMIQGFSIVDTVVDADNVTFLAALPAVFSSAGMGAPPLFATLAASSDLSVILPNHGLSVGDTFPVQVETEVGGLTIAVGVYTVTSVVTGYEFIVDSGVGAASVNDAVFENVGQITVVGQAPGAQMVDTYLWPLSRNEYAMQPAKLQPGRPSGYWFNRTIVPSIVIWPVPPPVGPSTYYGFVAYRMRTIQDANPIDGQAPDIPSRFFNAFAAELTAALAEKFRPEMYQSKMQVAMMMWDRASQADTERVSTFVVPQLNFYYS